MLRAADIYQLTARLGRPWAAVSPTPVTAEGPIWVLAPHPDDEVAGVGGTIFAHRAAGDKVQVIVVSDGQKSRALGLPPARVAEVRRAEAEAAAQVLGAELTWLGLPEMGWTDAPQLQDMLERDRPRVIYAPTYLDYHPEHQRAAHALAKALAEAPGQVYQIRGYPVHVPLTPLLTGRVHDTSAYQDGWRAALACHKSQIHALARTERLRRYAAAFYGATTHAETFWPFSVEAYLRIHQAPPEGHFQGIREKSRRDPVAYFAGTFARWRYRGAAV